MPWPIQLLVRLALLYSPFQDCLTFLLNEIVELSLTMAGLICKREHEVLFLLRKHQVLVWRLIPARISDVVNIELTCT